ncbi:hypothetical protein SAY87_011425 [Trapa incisa]|uniref:Uncharacterized protein n=2 Tax=Trapa TaxID=22665 RepID=A0AAN7LX04_TRANT|nr:hypothetical protein SAY87_011425 [Trapa incisa]KAK4794636.1 hypothetical protein SAY86_012630 [Trapa natans]
MEGLIPMVYRAIKRSRTHSRYECLSSSAARSYNTADFYVSSSYGSPTAHHLYPNDHDHKAFDGGNGSRFSNGHRRYSSVGDLSFSRRDNEQNHKQLTRSRSSRIISCLTGAGAT